MTSKDCIFDASITENEKPDFNVLEVVENVGESERVLPTVEEEQENNMYNETLSLHSREFLDSKGVELFENVPELKKTFVIQSKIGEGTFSNVYLAHLVEHPDEMFALKHIIPTSSPDRVEREVRCLQEMGGKNNVIGYKGTIRHHDHNVVILPYFPHDRFQDYLSSMGVSDIQDYMRNLLLALKHVHSFSIIHRDIKPGNFLHSRQSGRYNLVDFGLAMHEPGSESAWEIEKNNGKCTKTSNEKKTRPLSPESVNKSSHVSKKQRTSPRVAVTSHKLARHQTGATKLASNESTKPGCQKNANKFGETNTKDKNKSVKFVSSDKQAKCLDGKPSMLSSQATTGLCKTKHKTYEICTLCMKRACQSAPRAGTSGFRAPEVLLKYPQQTTAVDVWSAGIIMLCLLSGKYPFFRCADDMAALAQIMTVFGKERVVGCTKDLGKYLVTNNISPGFDLKDLCQRLRAARGKENEKNARICCSTCAELLTTKKNKASSPALNLRRTRHESESGGEDCSRDQIGDGSPREHLDGSRCTCNCGLCSEYVPVSAYDLLKKCLDLNPKTRITADDALSHPFFLERADTSPKPEK